MLDSDVISNGMEWAEENGSKKTLVDKGKIMDSNNESLGTLIENGWKRTLTTLTMLAWLLKFRIARTWALSMEELHPAHNGSLKNVE